MHVCLIIIIGEDGMFRMIYGVPIQVELALAALDSVYCVA